MGVILSGFSTSTAHAGLMSPDPFSLDKTTSASSPADVAIAPELLDSMKETNARTVPVSFTYSVKVETESSRRREIANAAWIFLVAFSSRRTLVAGIMIS